MKKEKKKINSNIIIGIILIILQIMSYIGLYDESSNILEAMSIDKLNSIYGIFAFIGANIFLIAGITTLLIGLKKTKQ